MYVVTKKFTTGALKGMTVTEKTTVPFTNGQKIKALAGSHYVVLHCVKIHLPA